MKTNEAVRAVMKKKEVGVNQMADRIGKSPRLVCDRLSQQNISIEKLKELLRVLDYEIAIVPRNSSLPEGGIKIE